MSTHTRLESHNLLNFNENIQWLRTTDIASSRTKTTPLNLWRGGSSLIFSGSPQSRSYEYQYHLLQCLTEEEVKAFRKFYNIRLMHTIEVIKKQNTKRIGWHDSIILQIQCSAEFDNAANEKFDITLKIVLHFTSTCIEALKIFLEHHSSIFLQELFCWIFSNKPSLGKGIQAIKYL